MSEELVEYEVKFKDIEGYIGMYQVTDDGRVFNKKFDRFLTPGITSGYLSVSLKKNKIGKTHKVHRLVAMAFLENLENKPYVDHIDGNKTNNSVNNLRWATNSENQMNSKMHKDNKLQIKGIYKTENNSYCAYITKDGKDYSKYFKKLEDAIIWRKQKEEELHGEFSSKN